MERDFFEKNSTMKNIFNNLADAVYFVDNRGVILFMNKAAERLDGFVFEDVRGRTVMETYGLDATESPLLRVVCSHEPLKEHFFRYYINGQEVYQICNTFPVQLEDGFWGSFSIQNDVTHLKRTIDRNIQLQKHLFHMESGSEAKAGDQTKYYTFDQIIGDHESMKRCKQLALNAAQGDSSVMLTGLTGSGKELFAQSIHSASPRRDKPFMAINCAAIPESLIESVLFGTVKGAYTGAIDRKGLFEEAHGGTLFLDEVNSMPLTSQAKLLRVLEEREVQPLGGKEQIPIDVRIISSCNSYPQDVFAKKEMRQDLFYRLAVVNILIPPLVERKSDIFLLAHHFIAKYNDKYHKNVLSMEDEITTFFLNYTWPGNVRQLRYCIECAMNLVGEKETTIKKQHLPFYLWKDAEEGSKGSFYQEYQNIEDVSAPKKKCRRREIDLPEKSVFGDIQKEEQERIVEALRRSGGNVSKAARDLGLSRQTLVYRMKKYKIN